MALSLDVSSSVTRVNQEKMKRHRETILPPSAPKGPAPARKGRVAAPATRGKWGFWCSSLLYRTKKNAKNVLMQKEEPRNKATRSPTKTWPSALRRTWWVVWSVMTAVLTLHTAPFTCARCCVSDVKKPVFLSPQQILNCALDDIEVFVARLQKAAEAFSQLNQRNKSKKNKKKGPAGLSPFLLLWWQDCRNNIVILFTSLRLRPFVSCVKGCPVISVWSHRLVCMKYNALTYLLL